MPQYDWLSILGFAVAGLSLALVAWILLTNPFF